MEQNDDLLDEVKKQTKELLEISGGLDVKERMAILTLALKVIAAQNKDDAGFGGAFSED